MLRNSDELLQSLALGRSDRVAPLLYNRLELAARECNSWIDRTARRFDRYNPLGHCLSGSGSARFCLCSTRSEAEKIASELESLNEFKVFVASTWRSPSIQDQAKQLGFGI
jgi:4-diphosphocytidyl-2-C-methyl-D-erythritol kinase